MRASSRAVLFPIPLVPPVTRQILPFILSFNVSLLSCHLFPSSHPAQLDFFLIAVGPGVLLPGNGNLTTRLTSRYEMCRNSERHVERFARFSLVHSDDDFSLSMSFFKIPESFRN